MPTCVCVQPCFPKRHLVEKNGKNIKWSSWRDNPEIIIDFFIFNDRPRSINLYTQDRSSHVACRVKIINKNHPLREKILRQFSTTVHFENQAQVLKRAYNGVFSPNCALKIKNAPFSQKIAGKMSAFSISKIMLRCVQETQKTTCVSEMALSRNIIKCTKYSSSRGKQGEIICFKNVIYFCPNMYASQKKTLNTVY